LELKQGLILLTGPTGCGKSTSLAAMVDYININRFCHIITLEDPIEFIFKPKKSIIIQRQQGSDMLSFASGLKHCLRQDPNVIMVGEMRDLETIATTITLAETGHLVLATLHTYNAAQTIDRIIDIFPPHQQGQVRMQLSMTLIGVISQRLIQRQDGGRVAAREIMINTPAVANIIRENKIAQLKTVIETSSKEGMVSMDQDLKKLVENGLISKQEAQMYMVNPELLDKFKFIK
jgi:twitching motility protein PilT